MPQPAVLITGAAKRLGRALTLGLTENGYAIAVHYRNSKAEAENLLKEIQAAGAKVALVQADLSNNQELAELIPKATKALGQPLDVLINNAGAYVEDDHLSISPESIRQNFGPNIEAPLVLSGAFSKHLPQGQMGHIINIIDQRVLKNTQGFTSYTVSKHALYAATKLLALDLAPSIRVNAIGPGPTFRNQYQSPEDFKEESQSVLLGKGPEPEEIVKAVLFLLNIPSVTGQMIALDGGQHLR